jgi:hypothetical protein
MKNLVVWPLVALLVAIVWAREPQKMSNPVVGQAPPQMVMPAPMERRMPGVPGNFPALAQGPAPGQQPEQKNIPLVTPKGYVMPEGAARGPARIGPPGGQPPVVNPAPPVGVPGLGMVNRQPQAPPQVERKP